MEKETKISITFIKNENFVEVTSDTVDMEMTGVAAKHFVYELVEIYEQHHENSTNEPDTLLLMGSLNNFKKLILEKIDTLGRKMMMSLHEETLKIIDEIIGMEIEGLSKNEMRKQIDKLVPSEANEYKENLLQLWANRDTSVSFKPILH